MRLLNLGGTAHVLTSTGPVAVHHASNGAFGPELADIYRQWASFAAWTRNLALPQAEQAEELMSSVAIGALDAPSPTPTQVFAIGLNYHDHAAETATPVPEQPTVFTKFQSSIDGPWNEIKLSGDRVDWEVELVVVIGEKASNVPARDAWQYVAGLTIGQDFSDRTVQLAGPVPQFSLGKSYPGYSPMGPALVTPDEFDDPDDLLLTCAINGELVQKGRTSGMVFSVGEQVAYLSAITTLLPGDVIFTGTPAGVGVARRPQRFLSPGDEVVTEISGLGRIRSLCV